MYLLDTNVCVRILNGSSPSIARHFSRESPTTVRLCSIVKAELLFGARKSRRVTETLEALHAFFSPLDSFVFDDACAEHYGSIRADLERNGTPIGANDLLIASIARRHDAILVTHNTREFTRVVGLQVVDWEAD